MARVAQSRERRAACVQRCGACRARARGCPSLIALPTSLRSTPRSSGLETKSNAPSFSARTADSTLPCAVITATGSVRTVLLDPGDQIQAVAVGQAHVGQAQIETLRAQQERARGQIAGRCGGQIHAAQGQGHQLEQIRLVVHDQHQRLAVA